MMYSLILFVVSVASVSTQTVLWQCDFESNFCGFTSGTYVHTSTNALTDDFRRDSLTTPSGGTGLTGPIKAQDGDFYMHFEASFRRSSERSGIVTSPFISVGNDFQNVRVNFYFYDHGDDLDKLNLRILHSDGSSISYPVADDTSPTKVWNFTSIAVTFPGSPFRIEFEASTKGGFTSDWAIDTITVTAEEVPQGCSSNPCHGSATCTDITVAPFFICSCVSGYQGDGLRIGGTGCSDVNECNLGRCTGANIVCLNTVGGYSCSQCQSGYQYAFGSGDSYSCIDINECNNGVCTGANSLCINSPGSYSCSQCQTGYEYDFGSGNTYSCKDINECLDANYCTGSNTFCTNQIGSQALCQCLPGFTTQNIISTGGNNVQLVCTRNECLDNPCPSNSQCQDLNNGYRCVCSSGYEAVPGTGDQNNLVCRDIDECLSVTCDTDADCINLPGSFACNCRGGFRQVGTQLNTQCFLNGGLSQWANFQGCSTLCGGGEQEQRRSCTAPVPEAGGNGCDANAALTRTILCNTNSCTDCEISKPCRCNKAVQYETGLEPDSSLSAFAGIEPSDTETALIYLNLWKIEYFNKFCLDAHCNLATFQGGINNVTTYINTMTSIDEANENALSHMREVIDCNENEEIEAKLWQVYDLLCDRGVAIRNIKLDLIQKRKMFEQEKDRCEKRSWFGSMVEKFYKKF